MVKLFSRYVATIIPVGPRVEVMTIDESDIIKSIQKGITEYTRWSGKRCEYVIVGRDIFERMRVSGHQYLRHEIVLDDNMSCSIFGCTVVLAPYIEGMIFLPDITKGRR